MNILFYRYNSICEPDMIEVLGRYSNSIDEITIEMDDKNISSKECLCALSSALQQKKYDFVFSINFFPVISEVCNIFKIRYVCWIVDSPVMELYSHSIRNSCNRIFLFDYALYEEFYQENPECIYYLPLGSNYHRIDNLIGTITKEDKTRFSADISFVGSLYTEKCPYNHLKEDDSYLKGYLDGLIEAQLKVYGYNFLEECLTDQIVAEFKNKISFYQFPEKSNHNDKAAMAHLYLGNKVTEQERLRLLGLVSTYFKLDLYTGSDTTSLPNVNARGLAKSCLLYTSPSPRDTR